MTESYRYKAFISYSHRDKAAADKLLKNIENYRVPKRLVGKTASDGMIISDRVGHIFRDRDELAAAEDLTAEVKKALTQSEFMIVLCSPAAAASRWVNREIIEFKKLTGERRILSVILSGEPFASNQDKPEEECFPPALRFKLGKGGTLTTKPTEPLAADFRISGDGPRRGKLKLVAGLLSIGLDALIERDLQRKMRRVMAVTAASVLAMIGMASLTHEAVTARQDAERHRGEAEGLIEFMLTDLRDKLEPVGRLDVLDAVGEKAVDYYDRQALGDMPDEALGRRARAFHLLGEIQSFQGNRIQAKNMFKAAYNATGKLLYKHPQQPEHLFNHSQSAYWMGDAYRVVGDYNKALALIKEYAVLASTLTKNESKPAWLFETAYAESNLGTLYLRHFNSPPLSIKHFNNALSIFSKILLNSQNDKEVLWEIAETHAWLADAKFANKNIEEAKLHRIEQIKLLQTLQQEDAKNYQYRRDIAAALLGLGRLEEAIGNIELAVTHFQNSALSFEALTDFDIKNLHWVELSVVTHSFWSNALLKLGKFKEAEKSLITAKKLETQLFSGAPQSNKRHLEAKLWRVIVSTKLALQQAKTVDPEETNTQLKSIFDEFSLEATSPMFGIPLKEEYELIVRNLSVNKYR